MYATLQAYADAHWDGDKFKALHDLLFYADVEKGKMDDYIQQLVTEEADFVYDSMKLHAYYVYGSEEGFRTAVKAETYASSLKMELDEIRSNQKNPFVKKFPWDLAKLAGAVGLMMLSTWLTNQNILPGDSFLISAIPTVLCAWVAMSTANHITKFFHYRKAYRLAQDAPIPDLGAYIPTFEECMAFHQEQAAKNAVNAKKK